MAATRTSGGSVQIPQEKLRIVLFGRTAVGKSTLGRILVGDTSNDPPGDHTKKCHVKRTEANGLSVVVVDTPGLFKMGRSHKDVLKEVRRSIENAEPGPHVFLLVERHQTITSEELEALEVFQCTFGKRAMAYAMVVFTSDQQGGNVDMKANMRANDRLRELIERCQWRYFIFNFADNSPVQATELLRKIKQMREGFSEFFYTPQMFQEAERHAKEEQWEQQQKTISTQDRLAILEKSGWIGAFVGAGAGYLIYHGKLTATACAVVGGLVGMIVIMGIALSFIWVSEKCLKKF